MIFHVLGELEVHDAEGRPVGLPHGHDRTVLAALLMRPNRQLSKAELVTAGWGPDGASFAQLHKTISALRKLLATAGIPEAIKTYNRFGYELRIADDELDMLAFHRQIEAVDAARSAQRTADEIAHIRRALALWHGPQPLANVDSTIFRDVAGALRRRRKRIAARLFALENARGESAAILDELQQFVAEEPTDAQLTKHLMIALYAGGHGVDAIGAYDRHAEALDQATGGRPEQALRDLCYAIAAQNDEAVTRAASLGEGAGPAARHAPVPRQLPAAPAEFVGRGDLLAELVWLLHRPGRPVLVISGPGGIGKTALALRAAQAVAEAYPDGQLWAELRGTAGQPAEPAEVLAQFLRALGVPVVPDAAEERAALFRTMLAGRRLLVVLDDAADARQVRDLVPGAGGCAVLITARRRLPDIRGGVHHLAPLSPFDRATATELFRGIVSAAKVDLRGEDGDVDEVVRLCGGLPLALRIAASLRVEDFHRPTAELARRLAENGPAAFEFGDDCLARTLGAGLAPLDARARRLFLGLGLLRLPTFTDWTASAVLGEPGPAAGTALSQLAAVSMVEPAGPGGRYRFHDLTGEYARGRAETELPAPQRRAVPERACRALLTLTRRAHAALYGGPFEVVHSDLPDAEVPPAALAEAEGQPVAWFERERPNIRAAVAQAAALGLTGLCWDLAVSAHEFYTIGEYFDDWRDTHQVALAACRRAGDRRGEGIVLALLGQPPLVASGSPGVSRVPELEAAVRLLAEAGERHGQAIAQRTLANALRRHGELHRPLTLFTEALGHYEASGDAVGRLQALRFVGQTQLDLGDVAGALRTLRRAQAAAVETGRPRLIAQTAYWVGRACLAAGDPARARQAFEAVRASGVGGAQALHGFGDAALAAGDPHAAREHLTEADALAREGTDANFEGRVALSMAALETGQREVVALLRAVACFQSCGGAHLEIEAQAALAAAQLRAGDLEAAEAAWDRIDELYTTEAIPLSDRLHHRP